MNSGIYKIESGYLLCEHLAHYDSWYKDWKIVKHIDLDKIIAIAVEHSNNNQGKVSIDIIIECQLSDNPIKVSIPYYRYTNEGNLLEDARNKATKIVEEQVFKPLLEAWEKRKLEQRS